MTVAVCIPTYNQAEYLEACIDSVMKQSLTANEVIVSDDCSTDNTAEVLEALKKKYSRLRVIHQKNNLGLTQNSNASMQATNCDYIVRMGSDDLLLPEFISEMSSMLNRYEEAGYVHCNLIEIDKSGKQKRKRTLYRQHEFETANAALMQALQGYKVAGNIIMYKRSALEKTSFLKSQYNFAEDFYVAADLAAKGFGNCFSKQTLAAYRVWNDKKNVRTKRKLEEIKGLTSVFKDVIEPAFVQHKLPLHKVKKAENAFAKAQANSLSWRIFNAEEKRELKKALLQLSSTTTARINYFLYEHKLHGFIDLIKTAKNKTKLVVKNLYRHK